MALSNHAYRLAFLLYRRAQRWLRPHALGAQVMLIRDEQVLLARPRYRRHWYFPGGTVDRGESVERAARREASEEVGATVGAMTLFGVYSHFTRGWADHVVLYLCSDFELGGDTDWEIEAFRFFPLDDLPSDISPGTVRRGLQRSSGAW